MPEQGEQVSQASTMMEPKRWPLVTQPSNRSTSYLKDSRLVNCYAERTPEGYEVEKRFGTALDEAQSYGGTGYGMYTWNQPTGNNTLIVATAAPNTSTATLYITSSVPPYSIALGPVNVLGSRLRFCQIPGVLSAGTLMVCGGYTGYVISSTGGGFGLQPITDTNFPLDTVPGIAYLDGTTYVMDVYANIWGTNGLNNALVWSATNVIPANSYADLAVALARQLDYVVALKQWTTQFYYDNANATGSPLSPLSGTLLNYGCLSSETLQEIDGLLLWVTSSKFASPQVLKLTNLQPEIVSTPAIDRLLDLGSASSQFSSMAFKWAGHRLYVVTNVTANITMAYDIDQKLWYQWTDYLGNFYPMMDTAVDLTGHHLFQHASNGNVYFMDADYVYPNDYGNVFPVDIYTPNFDAGVDRIKFLSQMRINADQTPGSTLSIRFSEDDYTTWNNFRQIDLSQTRPILNDEGSFYRRAYHFRHQANTALRIRSVDLQMDIGTL